MNEAVSVFKNRTLTVAVKMDTPYASKYAYYND